MSAPGLLTVISLEVLLVLAASSSPRPPLSSTSFWTPSSVLLLAPNLTTGMLSRTAIARPFFLVCFARPGIAGRGPYLSGLRLLLTSPMTRNPPKSAKITANAAMKIVTARLVGGELSFLNVPLEFVGVGDGALMIAAEVSFLAGGELIVSCYFAEGPNFYLYWGNAQFMCLPMSCSSVGVMISNGGCDLYLSWRSDGG